MIAYLVKLDVNLVQIILHVWDVRKIFIFRMEIAKEIAIVDFIVNFIYIKYYF